MDMEKIFNDQLALLTENLYNPNLNQQAQQPPAAPQQPQQQQAQGPPRPPKDPYKDISARVQKIYQSYSGSNDQSLAGYVAKLNEQVKFIEQYLAQAPDKGPPRPPRTQPQQQQQVQVPQVQQGQ